MDEMDVHAVYFCQELGYRIESPFGLAPIVERMLVGLQFLEFLSLYTLGAVGHSLAVRPPGRGDPSPHVNERIFGNFSPERAYLASPEFCLRHRLRCGRRRHDCGRKPDRGSGEQQGTS